MVCKFLINTRQNVFGKREKLCIYLSIEQNVNYVYSDIEQSIARLFTKYTN